MVQIILRGEIDFSALAIDTGILTKQVKEAGDCLYVEVQNNANLPVNQDDIVAGEFIDRAEIEKRVLSRLTATRYPQYREFNDELVNLIIKVKEAALAGEGPQEIISEIALLAGRLPGQDMENSETEVASAGGESFENKED